MWSWIAVGLTAWFALALMVGVVIGRAASLADQMAAPGTRAARESRLPAVTTPTNAARVTV